jgi:hypothetical protein
MSNGHSQPHVAVCRSLPPLGYPDVRENFTSCEGGVVRPFNIAGRRPAPARRSHLGRRPAGRRSHLVVGSCPEEDPKKRRHLDRRHSHLEILVRMVQSS